MKIKATLGKLDKVITELERYKKNLDMKCKEFSERLAQLGVDESAYRFKVAKYDGINDVFVESYWRDDDTLAVSAKGNSVTFIEFGAGVHYTEQHPKAEEMGALRGEYGKKQGKRDYWVYIGAPGNAGGEYVNGSTTRVITHGNPPARAMYEAGKLMRDKILEIAKEIFNND